MAIVCAQCGRHIAPFNDGGDLWYCTDCKRRGYGPPETVRQVIPERTSDGHPQVWLLYRPEPFEFGGDDDRSIHLWVRQADVFTSRAAAMAFLDNLSGRQVQWRPYNESFPELWIGEDRGHRWLLCPAPVDPPGGQR